jgi:predicted AlkP superfamily phosphohydrolase/phosphomutase/tetratricopeptide (TPR) repeat protein
MGRMESSRRRVLLIGWDAADWKVIRPLIAAGKMPNVEKLVKSGASGPIATLHPPLSPMLWTSIATGKRPFKHGIHGFSEPTPDGRGVRPISNLSRTSKAVWNILNQSGLRSAVVGWWPSHPAEPIDGVMVSDHYHHARGPASQGWPLMPGAVHPPELAEKIASLRVHPDHLTPDLVEPFVPLAREIDQDRDKRLALLLRTLAESMSVDAAANWLLENTAWDFFAVYYDSIDHFCHGFMKYHPPRQSWVGERDFDLYHNVVSMAYQLHDRMLGALLRKAGDDTTVILISDHGFHPDHLRPAAIPDIPAGPAIEHSDFGILAMAGPGIAEGARLDGASLLDVAPTVLTLYGLPAGEDMDGKVLSASFSKAPEIEMVPSWEEISGNDGRHPPYTRLDPVAAQESLDQMIALGYIERPDTNRETAVAKTIRELRYNLGEAYQDADRHLDAHRIFSELCTADPDEQRFGVRLFVSCLALGLDDEMQRIVDDLDGRRRALFDEAVAKVETLSMKEASAPLSEDDRRELARSRELARYRPAVTDYLRARMLSAGKRHAEALAVLERLSASLSGHPRLLLDIAGLYRQLGRREDARQVYEKVLALDSDNADAHIGLCGLALRERRFDAAAHSALDALQRIHQSPVAHFLLGLALAGMNEHERAAEAFRTAISLNPNFPQAHLRLARLLEKHFVDVDSAREHRRHAREMKRPAPSVDLSSSIPEADLAESQLHKGPMPRVEESVVIVTGLPRSGTSMLMQMLAAGGMGVLADAHRQADEDNPRGYFEYEAVKNLMRDATWLAGVKGTAIKIVTPLLTALPRDLACRVILIERDMEEVLDSQERMLMHRGHARETTAGRRRLLNREYQRLLDAAKSRLAMRPHTALLMVRHSAMIVDPLAGAEQVNRFLDNTLDTARMAAAIDPALHRVRLARA